MVPLTPKIVGTIEEPKTNHIDAMVKIFSAGQSTHYENFPDIFEPPTDKQAIRNYIQSFFKPRNPLRTRNKYSIGWIIDDKLCGYLLYHLYQTSDIFFGKNRWVCFVEDIAVDPGHHKQGGATLMMSHLKTLADNHQNCLFSAQIWRGNEASKALFKKFGFTANSSHYHYISK